MFLSKGGCPCSFGFVKGVIIVPNPFDGGDFFPISDDESGECYQAEWYAPIPCSGKVELRAFRTGSIPCCEAHFECAMRDGN